MIEKRRNAQLGLVAAAMLLVGCMSILLIHDRKASAQDGLRSTPPTPTAAVTPKL